LPRSPPLAHVVELDACEQPVRWRVGLREASDRTEGRVAEAEQNRTGTRAINRLGDMRVMPDDESGRASLQGVG
jgi:hypothetical protein